MSDEGTFFQRLHSNEKLDADERRGRSFGHNSLRRFMYVLIGYWSLFWLLNGLDKFFNWPYFFGVTRDVKFVAYFARLDLPSWLALFTLNVIGLLEVVLGVVFAIGLIILDQTRRIALVCLEISLLAFFAFSIADILFGDRQELWEHGTYIVLVIVSFLSTLFIAREIPTKKT